jgi:hypothetical protein
MAEIETVQKEIGCVISVVDSVQSNLEDPADSKTLLKALGLLEQANADLNALGEQATSSNT